MRGAIFLTLMCGALAAWPGCSPPALGQKPVDEVGTLSEIKFFDNDEREDLVIDCEDSQYAGAFKDISIKNWNGDVTIQDCVVSDAEISDVKGDVLIVDTHFDSDITIVKIDGKVFMRSWSATGDIIIAEVGAINANCFELTGDVALMKVGSNGAGKYWGDVRLKKGTLSGDVKITNARHVHVTKVDAALEDMMIDKCRDVNIKDSKNMGVSIKDNRNVVIDNTILTQADCAKNEGVSFINGAALEIPECSYASDQCLPLCAN